MTDNHRQAFERALQENPLDTNTRLMYADWLEENGHDDEATEQRRRTTPEWLEACKWMHEFAAECGQHCENYSESFDWYREQTRGLSWQREEDRPRYKEIRKQLQIMERWRSITYEDCLRAGYDYLRDEAYFVQQGSEQARHLMYEGNNRELYWQNWFILTGETRGEIDQGIEGGSPFSCSC